MPKVRETSGRRAARNFLSLLGANIVVHVLGFVAVVYLARRLSVQGFGRLVFAQALLQYFALVGNLGLNRYGIREVARDRNSIRQTVNCVVSIQTIFSILAAILMALLALILPRPAQDKMLIAFYGLYIVLTGIWLDWVYKGLERMTITAASQVVEAVIYVALVFALVRSESDILRIPLFAILSLLFAVAVLGFMYVRQYGWPRPCFDKKAWQYALRASIPIFFSFLLVQVFYSIDTVMLGLMKTDQVVGLYNAAYKIIFVIISVGSLLQEVIFPLLARFYRESTEKMEIVLRLTVRAYVAMALPLAVGGTLLARPILLLIYGHAYEDATLVFQILICGVAEVLLILPFGFALIACDQERKYMFGVAAGAISNIILNIALIPPFGMTGAAIATVASQLLVVLYMIASAKRVTSVGLRGSVLKPAIAAAAMGLAVAWSPLHVLINILIGSLAYLIVFSLIRGVGKEDYAMFKRYVLGRA